MNTMLRSCKNLLFACGAAVLLLLAIPAQAQSIDKAPERTQQTVEEAPHDPLAPIEIGPREEVGKESLGSKAARKAVGGVLGRVLGGSRGSSAPKGPRTRRDPTRRQDYVELEKPEPGITVGARSRWTDDGLLVSTRISDHDEKGTYHSVYVQSCDGRRLYPRRLEIYDLWAEHSLTVSWTRTTYVDGQVVNRESGGWSDAWSEVLGRHTVDEAELPGIWQMYGYDRAHSGIQQLGAYFNLDPEQLAELGDLTLITHITRPEQDPVITEPFNWLLSGDAEQPRLHDPSAAINRLTDAPSHWQQWQEDCELQDARPGMEQAQTDDETGHIPPHPEELESPEPGQEGANNTSTTSAAPPDESGSVEVRILSVEGDAGWKFPGGDQEWKQLEEGEVLPQGTEVFTGFDGRVRLGVYKDGKLVAEIEIDHLSLVTINRFLWDEEAVEAMWSELRGLGFEIENGEIKLDIKTRDYNSDSTITAPSSTHAVRGTILSVATNGRLDQVTLFKGAIQTTLLKSGEVHDFGIVDGERPLRVTTDGTSILTECRVGEAACDPLQFPPTAPPNAEQNQLER